MVKTKILFYGQITGHKEEKEAITAIEADHSARLKRILS